MKSKRKSETISRQMKMETQLSKINGLYFFGSKITADGDCSHEIKRRLLLGRKVMTNLESILKSRDITLPTNVPCQGYGFSSGHVWMWELDCEESWVLKNWCFELWCWRRLLGVPWTARRSQQSILKEISPACLLEGLMLKLKLQYFGHLMRRVDSLQETVMLGRTGGRRRRGRQGEMAGWHHRLDGHVWVKTPGVCDGQGDLACYNSWGRRVRHDRATELNWTDQKQF